ncbi:YczE/YyaS/YitT family protein [Fusobacterium sp.]|uniref:YczE/YyaS/YitT family protein n=1 Tax=Fusobacterium sp. TaxID=68766 RepID=UPI00396CE2BB
MNINYFKKYSLWILTVCINAFGNFLMIKSEIGSGPWIAASMGIAKATDIPIGVCTIMLNFAIYIPIMIISRKFDLLRLIGSFFVAFIFGKFLDFFIINIWWIESSNLICKILIFLAGDLILTAGISMYLRLNIALNPFDQFLQTVNEFLIPDIRKANLVYLGVPLLMATLLGIYNGFYFRGIGIGTIFMFFFNGIFIKFYHKFIVIPNYILNPRSYIKKE